MICGYVSCAVAVQAADLFPQTTDQWPVVTLSDIDSIVRALTLVPEELERRIALSFFSNRLGAKCLSRPLHVPVGQHQGA